jgi:hypothetical protein
MMLLRAILAAFGRAIVRIAFLPVFLIGDIRNRKVMRTTGDVLAISRHGAAETGIFCILVVYQRYGLPAHLRTLVEALGNKGLNVVVVHNLPLTPEDRTFLEPLVHTIIGRRNIGRDFGAYRTGILHVLDTFRPTRIVLLNDSVFYTGRGLGPFLDALTAEEDFIGAAENYEFAYHVGSYALSFGPRVFEDPRFRRFWEKYRLTDLRPAVIWRGELALNRLVIRKIGVKPDVIFRPGRLRAALENADVLALLATARQMPSAFGRRGQLFEIADRLKRWVDTANERPSTRNQRPPLALVADIIGTEPEALMSALNDAVAEDLRAAIMNFVVRGSQIHWGALPLVKHLGCPVVKADLLLRSIYTAGDLGVFAKYMSADEFAEFHGILTARGIPNMHWSLRDRLLLSVGYI